MALKDANQLVKQYAMVNVSQYSTIVSTANTVAACEQEYLRLLSEKGVTAPEELPQTTAQGVIAEIRTAVMDGNSYYFIRLEGEEVFYSILSTDNEIAVILNAGDRVTIEHAPSVEGAASSILDGYTVTLDGRAAPEPSPSPAEASPSPVPEPSPSPEAAAE